MATKHFGDHLQAAVTAQEYWLGRSIDAQGAENLHLAQPRQSIRRPVSLDVLVNHGMTFSVPSHVSNLSMTGALVEMDAPLPVGALVEVVLRYRWDEKRMVHNLPATVTRVEPGRMGISFEQYDDETYTDLANLLYLLTP